MNDEATPTSTPRAVPRERHRSVVAGAAIAALVVLTGLIVLLSPSGWRTELQLPIVADTQVATLNAPGETACADVAGIPDAAGRAEFPVHQTGRVVARSAVRRGGIVLRGPRERVPVEGGVVRLRLPEHPGDAAAWICIESAQATPIAVLGSGAGTGLRLVGDEPQTRLAQFGAMLDRVHVGTAAPLSWLSGWRLAVVGGVLLLGALALIVRGWYGDGPTRRAWAAVAALAVLHAWTWAALNPAFQVPDETVHFHYATFVADHGHLPRGEEPQGSPLSDSHGVLVRQLDTALVASRSSIRPPWTGEADRRIDAALVGVSTATPDVETNATNQPPLYYLSVAPAALGAPTALDQLARMRLLSGLWMAVAALGAVALVRWLLPTRPRWALTAGLVVALFPLLGFLAGGITPDVALTALSFWVVAAAVRCWRAGLSPRRAVGFGVAASLLLLTKLTAMAIVPGALLIVATAAVRDGRRGNARTTLRTLAIGVAVALIPVAIYVVLSVVSGRPLIPRVVGVVASDTTGIGGAAVSSTTGGFGAVFESIWQLYLPRLPGQVDAHEAFPLWSVWADGLAGRFGYLEYGFSEGTRRIIAAGWLLVVAAAAFGFVRLVRASGLRDVLRRFGPVLVGGVVSVVLLLGVIGATDYNSRKTGGPPFQQARYLLPGLPVALLAVPLALRAFGRRTRPAAAVVMVGLMVLWAAAALGLTLARYYG